MQFNAIARNVRLSPFKLRPMADVIRGKNVNFALNWLDTAALKKAVPLKKLVASAAANAKHLQNFDAQKLIIKEVRIDQGPTYKYFRPGAMGRANVYKKRFSHISVVLEPVETKEVSRGTKS